MASIEQQQPMHDSPILPLPVGSIAEPLYVVAVISNPIRWVSRYHLYREFADYIAASGAILYTVELAFGDRPFEITHVDDPHHIRVRTRDELWHKENLINIGISRLPADWKYTAWIDADVRFARPDWVYETKHQLQHYMFVQLFSKYIDLGPDDTPIGSGDSFVSSWLKQESAPADYAGPSNRWHPGFAWAARREALDGVGGLIDWAIVGSGDRHMSCAMIGRVEASFFEGIEQHCRVYEERLREWQRRCDRYIRHDVGVVDGLLLHSWHGPKKNRGYNHRWRILMDNDFDPNRDIKYDTQGVLALSDEKSQLRDDLRRYFRSRREDDTA